MFTVGAKIKGTEEFTREIEEAEILEIRFHMAEVKITKSSNPSIIGEVRRVLLAECDLVNEEENNGEEAIKTENHSEPAQDNDKFKEAVQASFKDGSIFRALSGQKPLQNDVCQYHGKPLSHLNAFGSIKCIKDVVMDEGMSEFTDGQRYRYFKRADRYFAYNNSDRPHIIYSEPEGDMDNFLSDHFEIIS